MDLIVMASHGRSGLVRLVIGSVAEAVMRKAPCPVLVVKQPHETPVESRRRLRRTESHTELADVDQKLSMQPEQERATAIGNTAWAPSFRWISICTVSTIRLYW